MLRIIGRENYRETLLVSGESERAAGALSRHLGVYLGTNPGFVCTTRPLAYSDSIRS